jgi:hypothetical protein
VHAQAEREREREGRQPTTIQQQQEGRQTIKARENLFLKRESRESCVCDVEAGVFCSLSDIRMGRRKA